MTRPFPRITVPGVDPEAASLAATLAAAGRSNDAQVQAQREGMVTAMLKRGYRPYLGHVWRERKPTKHVRMKARLALRSTKGAGA